MDVMNVNQDILKDYNHPCIGGSVHLAQDVCFVKFLMVVDNEDKEYLT